MGESGWEAAGDVWQQFSLDRNVSNDTSDIEFVFLNRHRVNLARVINKNGIYFCEVD